MFLALMLAVFVYHFFLEWYYGTTLGKRPFGLRVVADDGQTAIGSVIRGCVSSRGRKGRRS
ncbi:MAG: RDD family protein [Halapricum sp.]